MTNDGETSVPGLYCIGDLTGVPLIKLAAESGYNFVERLSKDSKYTTERKTRKDKSILDLVIVGAGPAGVSACLRAAELGLEHIVLEASQKFNTIKNFPTGKPILITPKAPPDEVGIGF